MEDRERRTHRKGQEKNQMNLDSLHDDLTLPSKPPRDPADLHA